LICSGSILVTAGAVGQFRPTGMPFTPKRIWFASTTQLATYGDAISYGMYSDDRLPSPDHPQQTCIGATCTSSGDLRPAIVDKVVRISEGPTARLQGSITEIADNSFTLTISLNTSTNDSLIQWVATP